MSVEQKAKKAKKIQIIKDMDFSVVTHDGLVISCKPSESPNKLYCVFSTVELQAYFGITEGTLEKREKGRRKEVAGGEMTAIHVAIREQGFENFVMFEVAWFESKDEAAAAEKLYIRDYKTYNAVGGCGYNSSPGGQKGGGSYSEADGKTRVNQIIDFYFKHNRWPNMKSADEYEKSLGIALVSLRTARNNPEGSTCIFYASYQKIADERCVPEMFLSQEEHGQLRVKEIIDFYYKHNKTWPNKKSADKYEKSLGNALMNLRSARNRPEHTNQKFHASYQNIADERGVHEMFFSEEELKNWGIEKFAQFIKDNGRPPQKSIKEEKTLYVWMQNRKSDIKSGIPKLWTASNNETAIRFDVLKFFLLLL